MQKQSNIHWKLYEVSTTAPNGIVLKGEITYWSKDYTVCMTEPFKVKGHSGHLQYALPAVYATDEIDRKGVYMYRLIELAKENLLTCYKEEVKKCCY